MESLNSELGLKLRGKNRTRFIAVLKKKLQKISEII